MELILLLYFQTYLIQNYISKTCQFKQNYILNHQLCLFYEIYCQLFKCFFSWFEKHKRLQLLHQQSVLEANESSHEKVKELIVFHKKVNFMVYKFNKINSPFIVFVHIFFCTNYIKTKVKRSFPPTEHNLTIFLILSYCFFNFYIKSAFKGFTHRQLIKDF